MPELAQKKCKPCSGETPRIEGEELDRYRRQVGQGWRVVDGHHLERSFKFDDFRAALDFVNRVGQVAEQEQHHPDILLSYGKVNLTLLTHAIDGLSENDFIMAAKIDQL